MAINLGEERVLKEIRIDVDKKFGISGFLDLVDGRKIILDGKLHHLNDLELHETPHIPLIIHYKLKNPFKKTDNIWQDTAMNKYETAEEYLRFFVGNQTIHSLRINVDLGSLKIVVYSKPHGKWRVGHPDPLEYEILEAKNVPGLKDVVRK